MTDDHRPLATSTAVPDDVVAPDVPADPPLPPAPDGKTLLAMLGRGLPTVFAAMVSAGSLADAALERLPHTYAGNLVVAVVAAGILPVTFAGYKKALVSTRRMAARWAVLSMPFFVVVGAVLGWGLVHAMFDGVDREDTFFEHALCEAANIHSGPRYEQCKPLARACAAEASAQSRWAVRGDALDCLYARLPAQN